MLLHILSRAFNIQSRIDSSNKDDCDNDDGSDSFFLCMYTDSVDLKYILIYFTTKSSTQYTNALYTTDIDQQGS